MENDCHMTERLLKVNLNPKLDLDWFKIYIVMCKFTSIIPFIQIYNDTGYQHKCMIKSAP